MMKPSGIEWIGIIPDDWKTNTAFQIFTQVKNKNEGLQEQNLLSLSYGKIKRKGIETVGGLLPESFDGYNIIEADDIVLRLTDLQNDQKSLRVGLSPERGIVTSAYLTLRNRSNSLPQYLYYYLHAFDISKGFYGMGAGVRQGLNWDGLKWLKILTPPVPEQKKIVRFLDTKCARIDAVIEQTRASIEEYKKLKQSVITQAVTKGIRPGRKMKDSGVEWIGEIPEEWNCLKIKWLLDERNERSEHGLEEPLSMSQKYGLIPTKEMDMVPNMASSFVGAKVCYPGDLVFNKLKAHLGVFALSKFHGLVSPDYAVYHSRGIANLKYLEYLFKTPQYIAEFKKKSTGVGAGLTRLYTAGLYSIYSTIPPLSEQSEIVEYLDEKTEEISALIRQKEGIITELESYKKSLIYEYVTGKKEVPHQQETLSINFIDMRALLMCRIIELMKPKGRIHLLKALYAIDCLSGLNNQTQYVRYTHGPYDTRIEEYETAMAKHGWAFSNRGAAVEYRRGKNFAEYRGLYQRCFHDLDPLVRKICSFLKPMKTSQAERVATLLAVWNDFLLDGATPTDKEIVQEVRSHWTPNKAHSEEATWFDTLRKIKENNLVPRGIGLHTAPKTEKYRRDMS